MELGDLEGTADALYRIAGYESDEPASLLGLARRLLGPDCIESTHARGLPGDAALISRREGSRIYLRMGLSPARLRFAVAHELAHRVLGVGSFGVGSELTELEQACDTLAACLVAPRRAFLRALRETDCYSKLAARFMTTESCVALRFGEVTGEPTALVCPCAIYVRGEAWGWPPESELRVLATQGGPGLQTTRLRDAPRRIAMRAAN